MRADGGERRSGVGGMATIMGRGKKR